MTETTPHANERYTWNEFSVHLVAELDRLNKCSIEREKRLIKIEIEIAVLKIKIGIWGFAGSVCGFLAMWLIKVFM